ncbi:MAG TPA: ATP-binding protein, partial [Burkholderiaceae bacterium]|nr:ATP-binding protein [Burkholderiaceae bacterium]
MSSCLQEGDDSIFRTLFAAYPDALLVVDASGCIVLANPAAADLLGYAVEQLTGLGVDELVPDAIRPSHAAYRAAYARAPRVRPMGTQMELVAKRRDGSEVLVEIALSPLKEHGLPYTVAAIRGIATYPRVRQALQRARYSEQLAQFGRLAVDSRDTDALMQEAPRVVAEALEVDVAVIYLCDAGVSDLRIAGGVGLLWGDAVGDRVSGAPGTPQGFVLAQTDPVTIDDFRLESRFQVPQPLFNAGLTSGVAVPLVDRRRPVGVVFACSRAQRTFGDEELRFLESLANLMMTTLQRISSEEQLSHQRQLESIGQLTGGIAHDFNNLLTVISGNLQVMEDAPAIASDALLQQMLGAAARATTRGAELTSKLLAFSRRQVLQPSRIDTPALLQSLTGMLRRTLDQHIGIEVEFSPHCPDCLADSSQLESALLNIAINARDAMPDGGTLSFGCRLANPPEALRADLNPTGYLAISVADTGFGMPEEVKQRAFEPFFTTKKSGRGTGLGLSTVYGFAKQSRGGITLESTEGKGTTVTLYLPLAQEATPQPDDADDSLTPDHVPPGLRVLLVEDDVEVRAIVTRFLESLRCKVTTCMTAEQSLPLLA